MKNIKIDGENLIITIPRFTTRSNLYNEDYHPKMDNFIGVWEDENENGLAWLIDMDYAGKPDQISDYFYKLNGDKEEFEAMVELLGIEAMCYKKCSECNQTLMGTYTWGDKGASCFKCSED